MEYTFDQVLEQQIQEARNRAEAFSKSLNEARQQEALALKILEDERSRWTQSFEEKSTMIEQLERELTVTVDALNHDKYQDMATPSRRRPAEEIDPNRAYHIRGVENLRERQFDYRDDGYGSVQTQLLQAREELQKAYEVIDQLRSNESRQAIEFHDLSGKLNESDEDKRHLQLLLRDMEGKLEFRTSQVLENEQLSELGARRESELREQIELHGSRFQSMKSELEISNHNLKLAENRIAQLEQRLIEIGAPTRSKDEMGIKLAASEAHSKLLQDK